MSKQYEYKTVQMSAKISGEHGGDDEAAEVLQAIIDKHATDGYEFYRVDTFRTVRPTGCLGFGEEEVIPHNVATFRRPK
jgi:hypothetical protein